MSDKKISQLTNAAALAGTEVTPIVQSNVTVKTTVQDIANKYGVVANQASSSNNGWLSSTDWTTFNNKVSSQWTTTGSDIYYLNNVAIGTSTPRTSANKKLLTMDAAWGGQLDIGVGGTSYAQFGCDNYQSGASGRIQSKDRTALYADNTTLVGFIGSTGFAPENGKGIDFSATAGTGTSELLADYEEGTWTPTADAGLGGAYGGAGVYTKVGRAVYCYGNINVTDITGNITIGGLPYTNASTSAMTAGLSYLGPSVSLTYGNVVASAAQYTMARTGTYSGGALTIYFGFWYFV